MEKDGGCGFLRSLRAVEMTGTGCGGNRRTSEACPYGRDGRPGSYEVEDGFLRSLRAVEMTGTGWNVRQTENPKNISKGLAIRGPFC